MKKILLVGVLWCQGAFAQTSIVIWDVIGLGDEHVSSTSNSPVSKIELDATGGKWFISLHGGVRTEENVIFPATGSCFFLSEGIWCELSVRQMTYVMELNENLSGELSVINQSGYRVDSAAVSFESAN